MQAMRTDHCPLSLSLSLSPHTHTDTHPHTHTLSLSHVPQGQLLASSVGHEFPLWGHVQNVRDRHLNDPLLFMAYNTSGVATGSFWMSSEAHAQATGQVPSGPMTTHRHVPPHPTHNCVRGLDNPPPPCPAAAEP